MAPSICNDAISTTFIFPLFEDSATTSARLIIRSYIAEGFVMVVTSDVPDLGESQSGRPLASAHACVGGS